MKATFNTEIAAPAGQASGGNIGKTILILSVIGVALWAGYKYWHLPRQAKKEQAKV